MIFSLTDTPAHTYCLSFTHCHTHSLNDFLTHSMILNVTLTHCQTLSLNYLLSHSITLSVIDTQLTLRNNALTTSFYDALPYLTGSTLCGFHSNLLNYSLGNRLTLWCIHSLTLFNVTVTQWKPHSFNDFRIQTRSQNKVLSHLQSHMHYPITYLFELGRNNQYPVIITFPYTILVCQFRFLLFGIKQIVVKGRLCSLNLLS